MKYLQSMGLLLLAGCTVGPNYQAPDFTLPASYHSQVTHTVSTVSTADRWWETFHDAAINQLVDTALARNLDIASADAQIRQARAQLGMINGAALPQLSAEGRMGRDRMSKNSEFLANLPIANPDVNFTDYRAGLDASWEVDLFGHQRRSMEAAQARLTSTEQQRAAVALRIAAEVTRHVIDYRAWQLRSKNAQGILEQRQKILDLRALEEQAGLISESELIQAKSLVHQAAAAIPSLQSAAFASLMALTVLVDQPQEQVSIVLQNDAAIPAVPQQLDFLGLPSDLLQRRPDLRSAERDLAAATADIGVAVAEQYPRLTLVGAGGLDSVNPGKFTQLASTYWNLGPQLSIPIFAGGRLAAQVKNREARRDQALAHYRQAVLSAFADTETALLRYQREQQRLAQLDLAYAEQQRQVEFSEQRHQVGENDLIVVLETRQQLAQLHEQQLASQQTLAENLTALYKSLGGGLTHISSPN